MATFLFAAYVALAVIGVLFQASQIGKPRKPLTAGDVIANLVVTVVYVAGAAYLYTH